MSAFAKIVEKFGVVAQMRADGTSWGEIAQGLGFQEIELREATVRYNAEYLSYMEMANAMLLEELKAKFKRKAMELVDQPDLDPKMKVKVIDCVSRYLRAQLTHVQKMQINERMTGVKEKPSTKPRGEERTLEEALADYEALSNEHEQVMARLKQKK